MYFEPSNLDKSRKIVFAKPNYFGPAEEQAIANAISIAKYGQVEFIKECAAISLFYAF